MNQLTVRSRAADTVGSSLDHLIGSWSEVEADEIERAIKHFKTMGESHEMESRGLNDVINLEEKFSLLTERWQPRVVAELNDYQFKIARVRGEFVWHDHADTDEAFFVLEGTLRIDLPDGPVEIGPGELYVVPRGVRHRPVAEDEVKLLLVEPRGVVNTGGERDDLTADSDIWI